MLIMNCASIPVDMQEQMLFGAASDSGEAGGLFERASGGVLLLQSVESLSLRAQGALLKALQGGSPRRGGGDISAGPQIISATSDDLLELVESKQFRIDLYYRLSVYTLKIPPLVERAEDIEKLILGRIRYNVELAIFGNRFSDISPEALELMKAYAWPGNLKELNYAVDFAMSRGRGPAILVKDLPGFLTEKAAAADDPDEAFEPGNLKEAVERFELQYIQHTLHHFGGNISKSAAALGMKRQSLQYRLRKGKN